MTENEGRETLPEQRNDQAESYPVESSSRPLRDGEGYSLETLIAFLEG